MSFFIVFAFYGVIFAADFYFTARTDIDIGFSFTVNYADRNKFVIFQKVTIAAVDNVLYVLRF